MTPQQKRKRILEIEKDVQQIMMQLHHIEYKVDSTLVDKRELPLPFPKIPELKMPSIFKTLWAGFLAEMKHKKSPQ